MAPPWAGFTLVELLVVVTLTAVLVIIAVPSFKDLIERNRVAGEINSLVSDLQFARSEAIKRGRTQVVCVSSSGTACLDDGHLAQRLDRLFRRRRLRHA